MSTETGFTPVHCSYPSWTNPGPAFPSRAEAEAWLAAQKVGKDWGYVIDWEKQHEYEAKLMEGKRA